MPKNYTVRVGSWNLGPGFMILALAMCLGLLYYAGKQFRVWEKIWGDATNKNSSVAESNNPNYTNQNQKTKFSNEQEEFQYYTNNTFANQEGAEIIPPNYRSKIKESLPTLRPVNAQGSQNVITLSLVKAGLLSFCAQTDGKNHIMHYGGYVPLLMDKGIIPTPNWLSKQIQTEIREAGKRCPDTLKRNVQLIFNEAVEKTEGIAELKTGLSGQGYQITTTNLEQEGAFGLLSTLSEEERSNSFIFDITSPYVRLAWYENGKPVTKKVEPGYRFYTDKYDLKQIQQTMENAVELIPEQNRRRGYIIWSVARALMPKNLPMYLPLSDIQTTNTDNPDDARMLKSGLFLINSFQNKLDNEMIFTRNDHYSIGLVKSRYKR